MQSWRRLVGVAAVALTMTAMLALPSRPGEGSKPGKQVIIIATASVRGEISPCG